MSKSRMLTVVLAADAVGYSRLSENDETAALAAVSWFRDRAAEIVTAHGGRIFFRAGDGVMAELPTARAGVLAALELAETVRARVAHGDRPALPVRIGLHLGEVTMEGDGDRLGHDVNVAARIQQAAEPGEVLSSRALADVARAKVDARFERIGAERLKNLSEPVEMFRVVASAAPKRTPPLPLVAGAAAMAALVIGGGGFIVVRGLLAEPTTVAAAETAPLSTAQSDSPSIAVLPFVNMSSDSEQEYFSDGLSEELLNQLAKAGGLRVISRTSSFAFKSQNEDVRTIADALGVRHVLEGSVRKSGDQLRITAQLIDASDGSHVWSETYDRQLTDVFAIQEEIARTVADELNVALGLSSEPVDLFGTASFDAYDHVLRGRALAAAPTPANLESAIDEFEMAIAIDPNFGFAWAAKSGAISVLEVFQPERVDELVPQRLAATEQAVALAPEQPLVRVTYAWDLLSVRDWTGAIEQLEEARRLERAIGGGATVEGWVGIPLQVGRGKEAASAFRMLRPRDPLSPFFSGWGAWAFDIAGAQDEALEETARGQTLPGYAAIWPYQRILRLMMAGDRNAAASAFPTDPGPPGDGGVAFLYRLGAVWTSREAALAEIRGTLTDPAIAGAHRLGAFAALAGYYDDPELALAMLREEYFGRGGYNAVYLWHPLLAATRRTEGFKQLVAELGLVDHWRETGNWGDFCRPVGDDEFECF